MFKLFYFLLENEMKKFSITYAKTCHFIMHFCDLCWMKNTFFIKKNGGKIRVFFAFCAFFRDFWKIEKKIQVRNFFAFSPWPPVNIRATTGRSWADHGRQADRTEIKFRKKIRENIFTKKVSRANFVIILILHVKLSKRYPIVRKKRTIFYIALL